MMKDIEKISKIQKVSKELNNKVIEFNNRLPVSVEVLKKVDYTRYAIKLGNKEMTTKSQKELEVGAKYWGELTNDPKLNSLSLSNLHKKPPFLQKEGVQIAVEQDILLKDVLSSNNPKGVLKEAILQKMAESSNKDEYLYLLGLLMAMQYDVLSVPFNVNEKYNLFQMKKRRGSTKDSFVIDFYATYNNLGELGGTILMSNSSIKLYLKTPFEATRKLLCEYADELREYFSEVIIVKEEVAVLYEYNNNLLDIKG